MKRKFTFLIAAAFMLLTMMASTGEMWGQSDYSADYTGNVTLSTAGGTSATNCFIKIGDPAVQYSGIKAGTGSAAGAVKITVPSGTKYLHLHLAAWNGETVSLSVTPTGYSSNISLTSNSGISGNSPYTFSGDPSTSSYYKVITFTNALTANTDLTFTATSGKRFVVWGVTAEEVGSNPLISAEDVDITYDATGGSIAYTLTNATGNVTASITSGDWLELGTITESAVPFTCSANTGAERTATVTLSYPGATNKVVNVTQTAYVHTVPGYVIDFEYDAADYIDWTFTNMESHQTGNANVTAHNGTYYGTTGGKTASITTREKIATPYSLTCYVTKQSNNTTASTWKIQVSDDGSSWQDVASQSATSMAAGTWIEFSAKLTTYSDVFVRVCYDGSTAIRNIDDLSLIMGHSLTYTANNGTITGEDANHNAVNSGDRMGEGLTVTLTATPSSGYELENWIVSGTGATLSSTTSNPTTFTMGTEDANVTAMFEVPSNYIIITPTNPATVEFAGDDLVFSISTDQTLDDDPTHFYSNPEGTASTTKPTWIGNIIYDNGELLVTVNENTTALANTAYFRVEKGNVKSEVVTINQEAYSVETPEFDVETGTYYEEQLVDITCATPGASIYYTTNGTTPAANNGTLYDGNGVSITATTTLKAIAIKNNVSSEVAEATYTIPTILTITQARAYPNTTDFFYTQGVVTYIANNKTAYIQDASAAIAIYNSTEFTSNIMVGDEIVVYGKYSTYNGLVQITAAQVKATLTTGITVSPTVKTIAEINTDAEENNELQAMYVKIERATYNYQTNEVSQGNNSIQINNINESYDEQMITFTGIIGCVNNVVKIINISDIQIIVDPAISTSTELAVPDYIKATPVASINFEVLTVNGTNLKDDISVSLEDDDASAFEMSLADDLETWSKTVTLTRTGSTVNNAEIAVRLKANQNVNDYSDRIVLSSEDASTIYVNITGSVKYARVVYNGNGDGVTNVPTDNTNYTYNQEVTVIGKGDMAREGYDFIAWDTREDGTGITYEGGDKFNIKGDSTLYAQWDVQSFMIAKSDMINGDIIVKVGGVEVNQAVTDAVVTLSITPDNGYALNTITVTRDDNHQTLTVTNNAFTMPGSNVTVEATFVAVVTDALTGPTIGNNNSSYKNWENKTWSSDAVYKGNSSGNNNQGTKIQLRSSDNSGIVSTTSGGRVKMIHVVWSSNPATQNGRSIDIYGKNTTYTGPADLYNDNTQGTLIGSIAYETGVYTGDLFILNDYEYIGLRAKNGAIYFDEIQIMWEYVLPEDEGSLTHSTTVPENTTVVVANLEIPTAQSYVLTIAGILEVTGTFTNEVASHLIIEDGGQLVLPENATVQATVKKAVGHAAKSTGNWYTISSPVKNVDPASVTNLIQATATNYDFYYYNEPSGEWFNHKAAGHAVANMTNGKGYLYWNNTGAELSFPGELNSGDIEITVTKTGETDLAGFNLIGNPYSHNIYKGAGTAIPNTGGALATGFYMLSNSDSWVACTDNTTAIKPAQGILVKATEAGTVTMTNTTAAGTSKAGNDNIRFTVANNQYEDVAYAMFNNEIGLNKINHRNPEVPMLYIPQDGTNYAIATMSDDVEMFTLSFKTVTTGKYTLGVKLDGKYDYLHIVDRLTGEDIDMLAEGEYSFMGTPKDLVDRFIVKLSYNATVNDVNDAFAYQSGNEIIVNGEGELQIFDLMGRKVMTQVVNGVQTVNVPAQGVYIFRLNGKVQKIVVR